MHDCSARANIQASETTRVQARLAIIEPTLGYEGNDDILIKKCQVTRWSVNVAATVGHFPWPVPSEAFTLDRREGLDKSMIIFAGFPGNQLRVVRSQGRR
jgi:hypothetical protein